MKILTAENFKMFDKNGFNQDGGAGGITLVPGSRPVKTCQHRTGQMRSGDHEPRPSHLRRLHRSRRRWAARGYGWA